MKKIIGMTSALVVILLIAVGGFYLWSRDREIVSPVVVHQELPTSSETPILSEASSSSVVQEPRVQPEVDRGGCLNSDKYISELGDGRFLYKNEDLAISFTYPEVWGDPSLSFQSKTDDPFLVGSRCLVRFSSRQATTTRPALYISSNDFVFGAPTDAWGLDANKVDLAKSDKELIDQLSFQWTKSMKLERRTISGSKGIVLEEKGIDPMSYENYHYFYYLFPRYDSGESRNLAITVLRDADRPVVEAFLDTVIFY